MNENKFYNIQEATQLTKKSTMTIRRLIKKTYIDKKYENEIKLEKLENGSSQYLLSHKFLLVFFPDIPPLPPIQNTQNVYTPPIQKSLPPIQAPIQNLESVYTPPIQMSVEAEVEPIQNVRPPIQNSNFQKEMENIYTKQIDDVRADIQIFKDQLLQKDDQINRLLDELAQSRNQSNTLLMNIQQNLIPLIENQHKLLEKSLKEDIEPTNIVVSKRPFWKFW